MVEQTKAIFAIEAHELLFSLQQFIAKDRDTTKLKLLLWRCLTSGILIYRVSTSFYD